MSNALRRINAGKQAAEQGATLRPHTLATFWQNRSNSGIFRL